MQKKKIKTDKKEPSVSNEIKIEKDKTVEDLIRESKAEVPPVKEKKKETRGRPKKKRKPEWKSENYSSNSIAVMVNGFLCSFGNKIIGISKKGIPLTEDEKLKEGDSQIGEALCYTMEYYGLVMLEHPIFVMLIAVAGFGYTIYEKSGKAKKSIEQKKPIGT